MDENTIANKIPKLKLLKLNSLLNEENIQYKNIPKTERFYTPSKPKLSPYNSPPLSLRTQNNFHLTIKNNNQKKNYETIKSKNIKSCSHFPNIRKGFKKKLNNYNISLKDNIKGYNSYLKSKTNREYMKINRLLMEERLKRLSLPKFPKAKMKILMKKGKSKFSNDNNILEIEFDDDTKKLNIENKHKAKNSLFEKEKMKCREKFLYSLKKNFRELDCCEKKFDIVIKKTLRLLSYYGNSLSNLKTEET